MKLQGTAAALAAAGLFTGAAMSAAAATPDAPASPLLKGVPDCRGVAAAEARLACYDAAAARLETAAKSGDVVLVDRDQVRAARRQAFGFRLPSLDLFGGGGDEDRVDNVSTLAERAYRDSEGKWVVRTRDGQTWRQIDNQNVARAPKKGSKVEIRRAMMGSYFMNLDGQTAVRARREE